MQKRIKAVILAAGESSRFRPLSDSNHKSLTKLQGKELIAHAVQGCLENGVDQIIVVHSKNDEAKFKEALKEFGNKVEYAVQAEPKGMGDALQSAASKVGESQFFLLTGDRYDAGAYVKLLLKKSKTSGANLVLLSSETSNPQKYGVLGFNNKETDKVITVIEKPSKGEEPSNKRVVGVYLLPPDFLSYYNQVEKHQYAFEDALSLYASTNNARAVFIDKEPTSAKYAYDLLEGAKVLNAKLKRKISRKAQIAKNAIIEGEVVIGDGTRVFENAVIKGPVYIGKNCVIGNNALIRENTILEDGVQAGMNTEITRSIVLDNTHIHSGFIGDSVIGRDCRFGANFVTANRRLDRVNVKFQVKGEWVDSGKSFLGAVIGNNVKTGINASTMPGTIIGSNCIIGSGTEVKGNIEPNNTVYNKKELIIKKNG